MSRLKRKNPKIRQACGIILAIGGGILIIQTVPLSVWYILLGLLALILIILLKV